MFKPLIEIERAKSLETRHCGFWTFLYGEIGSSEDHRERICLRSVAKPFQTLACLRLGLNLNLKETAICTASHSGSDAHVQEVQNLVEKFSLNWQNLNCGEHSPIDRQVQSATDLTLKKRLQNNCSGKHTMLLATCKLHNWDLASYTQTEHPLQKKIIETLNELCETNDISLGLDGCGLPTYGIRTENLLKGFSKFQVNSLDKYIRQISLAMLEEAFYISGKGRLDYELTQACKPNLICKSGAGGLTVISFQHKQEALLVKMLDSDEKARAIVVKKLLQKMNISFQSTCKLFEEKIENLLGGEAAYYKCFIE